MAGASDFDITFSMSILGLGWTSKKLAGAIDGCLNKRKARHILDDLRHE